MKRPTRTVIVSTSHDTRRLQIVLLGLSRQTVKANQVVVAEDGEHDETRTLTRTLARDFPSPLVHVRQPHAGFRKSKILNEAILHTTSELAVFLDGDCAPHRCFVQDHLAIADPRYFVQGRRSFIEENGIDAFARGDSLIKLWFAGYLKRPFKSLRLPRPRIKEDAEKGGTLGCNLAIWKNDLLAINGFDERYEGWGREDSDLAARLLNLGRRRRVVWGQALVFHLNHPTQPRTGLTRNDALLANVRATRIVRAGRGLAEHQSSMPTTAANA